MSGQSKNHTLKGGTSLYSFSMGVPPPPGTETRSFDTLTGNQDLEVRTATLTNHSAQNPLDAHAQKFITVHSFK